MKFHLILVHFARYTEKTWIQAAWKSDHWTFCFKGHQLDTCLQLNADDS
jgi:hypothetical protein